MKKKKALVIVIALVLLLAIMLGNSFADENVASVSAEDNYDSSYYVEEGNNLFIKVAKGTNNCCYYIVDVVFGGIIQMFSSIIDN